MRFSRFRPHEQARLRKSVKSACLFVKSVQRVCRDVLVLHFCRRERRLSRKDNRIRVRKKEALRVCRASEVGDALGLDVVLLQNRKRK